MAQLRPPELYVEGSVFYEEQLEPLSSYNAIAIGAEPLSYKFIALDLNYALYFGGDNDERERLNDNFETVFKSVLGRDFRAWTQIYTRNRGHSVCIDAQIPLCTAKRQRSIFRQ